MLKQENPVLKVFHPRQNAPDAPSNLTLEAYIREIVSHTSLEDLAMRFFGRPNVEAIPGRITGGIVDRYEQPRDDVIVAFVDQRPVGYADVSRFSKDNDTAELSMLVCTDMQQHGIGQAMLQEAANILPGEDVSHLEAYIHPDNWKMRKAIRKWSQAEELHGVKFHRFFRNGEDVYELDLGS